MLLIREPHITHVKLLQLEGTNKILIAICKLIMTDTADSVNSNDNSNLSFTSSEQQEATNAAHAPQADQTQQQQISIVNLLNGECLHKILFNGTVLEMKSNADLLCVNSWNRIDAFDLNTFEHRFSLNSCYSQISKSSGKTTNPFALGNRWLAFADNKVSIGLFKLVSWILI